LQALRVFEIDKRSDYLITLSPARIQVALKSSYRSKINSDLLIDLGLLNYYGWLSYTLYDDIQDRDQALELVSIANLFHRRLINVLEILVSTLGASYQ